MFLEKEVTEERCAEIREEIDLLDNIELIEFESKDKVKETMQKESEIFKSILSQYDSETNPLQDTYLIKVKDINLIGETADKIKTIEGVKLVKYGEGMVEELVKIFDIVKKITYLVVVALILVTAFLISNTIKITISSRKREIEIMRLVGASNTYIKTPFFFEGIILGFLGSVIPIFACCYGYIYLYGKLGGQLFTPIIKLVKPDHLIGNIVTYVILIGVLVGAIGSYRAVRRFLKI